MRSLDVCFHNFASNACKPEVASKAAQLDATTNARGEGPEQKRAAIQQAVEVKKSWWHSADYTVQSGDRLTTGVEQANRQRKLESCFLAVAKK